MCSHFVLRSVPSAAFLSDSVTEAEQHKHFCLESRLATQGDCIAGFALVAEAVAQPQLKAGHCKSLKATAEEVEQKMQTVGGSEAS